MKRAIIVAVMLLTMLLAATAEETLQRPVDGLYESVVDSGVANDEPVGMTPFIRIGVDSVSRTLLWLADSNEDGSLENEEVYTYPAVFYVDGVKITEAGGFEGFFVYMPAIRTYRLITFRGKDTLTIDFRLVERW